jgi:hypothetical protein
MLGWDFTREQPDVAVQIEALEGFTYELRNPLQWFNALIKQPGSREWLQTMSRVRIFFWLWGVARSEMRG